MVENTQKKLDDAKGEQDKTEEKLPFCTTAASPEHHRSDEIEEPCDDGRAGK